MSSHARNLRHAPKDEQSVVRAERGVFDFNEVPDFPRDYLSTYYCQPPTNDERAVLSFLVRHYPAIASTPCAIEVGCGPTVHHALPLAPFVSEIHMADYLPGNLEQVRLWRDGAADAHGWQHYTALTLALEGKATDRTGIERREAETKRKITRLLPCDLKSDMPLASRRQYAVVGCFYCAENIGITRAEWLKVMRRLADLTAPGGHLFLSVLRETDFYVVKSGNGSLQCLPSAYLTERDLREALPRLGFDDRHLVVESASLQGQESEGVNGVILVAARKG